MPRKKTKPTYQPGSQADALHAAFDEFIVDRRASVVSPHTLKFYSTALLPFIEWALAHGITEPRQVAARHVQQYSVEHPDWKPSTRKVVNVAVRAWLRLCHERGIIDTLPTWKLPRVKAASYARPFLTDAQVGQVLAATKCLRDKALVIVLVDSGIRRGEAAPLVWGDVSLDTGTLRVNHGKGDKARQAHLGLAARAILTELMNTEPHEPTDPVFLDRSRKPLTVPALSRRLERLGRAAGVKLSSHRCRRTYATLSTINGMGLAALSATMGHSSIEQTKEYIKLLSDHLGAAHLASSPLDHLEAK